MNILKINYCNYDGTVKEAYKWIREFGTSHEVVLIAEIERDLTPQKERNE